MAFVYATFEEQPTDAARLAMLRQHISEVLIKINGPDSAVDSMSRSSLNLVQLLIQLQARRKELEAATGVGSQGSVINLADYRNARGG